MKTTKRIVMTLPTFEVGGMERFQLSLVHSLTESGHAVSVVSLRGGGVLRAAFEALGAHTAEIREDVRGPLALYHPRKLYEHVRHFGADVVHSVSGVWLPSAQAAKKAGGVPLLQVQHGLEPDQGWRARAVLRLAARGTHSLVAVSHEVLANTIRMSGATSVPSEVIANGLALPPLRTAVKREARAEFGIPEDAFLVGCLARFDPVKNLPMLVQAIAALHSLRPNLNVHLVLAGSGEQADLLRSEVARLNVSSRVHFPGMIAEPLRLLEMLDVCALISRTEGTPMSLIEAMAVGVPIVATDVGGIPSLLAAGRAGLLIPAGDIEAALHSIAHVSERPDLSAERIREARNQVEEHYEITAVAQRYCAIYDRIMLRRERIKG